LLDHLNVPAAKRAADGAAGVPPIRLSGSLGGAALLRELLQHNYDLTLDDKLLREAVVSQSSAAASANFDRLRKGYRARREVFGADVDVTLARPEDMAILQAMGCKLCRRSTGSL